MHRCATFDLRAFTALFQLHTVFLVDSEEETYFSVLLSFVSLNYVNILTARTEGLKLFNFKCRALLSQRALRQFVMI